MNSPPLSVTTTLTTMPNLSRSLIRPILILTATSGPLLTAKVRNAAPELSSRPPTIHAAPPRDLMNCPLRSIRTTPARRLSGVTADFLGTGLVGIDALSQSSQGIRVTCASCFFCAADMVTLPRLTNARMPVTRRCTNLMCALMSQSGTTSKCNWSRAALILCMPLGIINWKLVAGKPSY